MNLEQAEQVSYILKEIKDTEYQLKRLDRHSFGFGTSYRDIDEHLKQHAKFFLEHKLEVLKSKLKDY